MADIELRDGGQLTGRTVGILMESDYFEPEIHYYMYRFAEEGARTILLTRLWGQDSLTFKGHEYQIPIAVDGDLETVDDERLRQFDAIIVPSGMVSDRLRYTDDVNELPPAVKLLRRAFAMPEVLKGIICHGMWLVAPIPEVVRNRRITCHNNLVADVRNMGAVYTDQDVVVDDDLVTGRSAHECHEFARMIIDLLAARGKRGSGAAQPTAAVAAQAQATAQAAPVNEATAPVNAVDFPFADLVTGYITTFDAASGTFGIRTSDGRPYRARLAATASAEFLRNLGEPYDDAMARLPELLTPGRHVFAHGIFYPESAAWDFEAHRIVFSGRRAGEYRFEESDWWIRQITELGHFYRRAEFGTDVHPDYAKYRTSLRLGGEQTDSKVQETDTISRLVFGMSSAFLLTGNDEFLEVAERGTEYLRDHMRFVDRDEDVVYWYHGVELQDGGERKLFTSEFGDDYDAIPMYEQLYALGGPTQLYRITGDERIVSDVDGTLRLFNKFFRDPEKGGYFSHIDPIQLSPHAESLGPNRSRKNWNSFGDHAPAYLINLFLATGEDRHAAMLEDTFDTIVRHMPQPDSPFVQERFHADWSPDQSWNWQQNRAVVGHNLKIAWNLMRMMAIKPKPAYRDLAEHIGRIMPAEGSDQQRGGWYDVVEREFAEGNQWHRFTWHNRKAWWQQEQAILAYQILSGHTGDEEFRRHGREAAAFYNAYFPDHDDGGVYFNVLAEGTPYLVGNERSKGSHSMSMCHAAELCYLAAIYQRLLLNREPLTLHFRPRPDGFRDRVLRTAPDALPRGSVRLDWVEIDGKPYAAFDANEMTVKLPDSQSTLAVRAHLVPASWLQARRVPPTDDCGSDHAAEQAHAR
jgi:putative intracellular protease/amidase/mannose/cellobiose epimerase-like protein (N-acyl-D-glucosamine 2-epimerase family)